MAAIRKFCLMTILGLNQIDWLLAAFSGSLLFTGNLLGSFVKKYTAFNPQGFIYSGDAIVLLSGFGALYLLINGL
jgi:hypothetical protein